MAPADEIAARIDPGRRPWVVALDGPSAAGTSTLADVLADRLGAAVLRGDDFYRDLPDDERWGLDAAGGLERYFD
jgi:uridine kinase